MYDSGLGSFNVGRSIHRGIPSLTVSVALKGGRGLHSATITSAPMRHTTLPHGGSTRMSCSGCLCTRSSPWRPWWAPAACSTSTPSARVRLHSRLLSSGWSLTTTPFPDGHLHRIALSKSLANSLTLLGSGPGVQPCC